MTIQIAASIPYRKLGSIASRFEPNEMKDFESFLKQHYRMQFDMPEAQSLMDFYSKQSSSFNRFKQDFLSSPDLLDHYLDEGKKYLIEVHRTSEKLSDFIVREVKGVLRQCENNMGALQLGQLATITLVYDQLDVVFENELEMQGYMQSLIYTCITHEAMNAEELSSCCPKFVEQHMPELAPRAPGPRRR